MTPPEEFADKAAEVDADAIWISSSNGHAALWCEALRPALEERGAGGTLLYIGGNLAVGQRDWGDVTERFSELGFNRIYPPGTDPSEAVTHLAGDLAARRRR
jgi:methylaspartate mutase sigma subunit